MLLVRALIWIAMTGCVVHSTKTVDSTALPAAVGHGDDEVMLHSPEGAHTNWLSSGRLVVEAGMVCVRSADPAWAHVDAIRIAQLTDSNIAAILVDLPRAIRVVHLGGGEVELATNGRDIRRWLQSVAHDPADRGVARYRVMAWQTWRKPVTWSQLADEGSPMMGWPIEGTTAEVRHVNVGGTIALSVAMVPVVLAVAGIAVIARAPLALPSDRPRREPNPAADVPLAVVGAAIDASNEQPVSTWPAQPCWRPGS